MLILLNYFISEIKPLVAKYYRIILSILIFSSALITSAQTLNDYYSPADNLQGEPLKAALHEIIKGHTEFAYTVTGTDVWDILKETDRDTINSENVILLYSGWSVNAAQEYNNGNGWTREQVWAKSHGDFDTGKGAGTDVHHVRPVDLSVNSARNNKDFDWGGSLYTDGDGPTQCYSDADSWEPRDAVKGDIARMLFYMAVRYEGENGEPDLELVDDVNTAQYTESGKGFHGKLSTLIEWHKSDPVDSFEIRRNEIIFTYQNNRNPFIDHPEFVDKIWTVTAIDEVEIKPYKIFPNPSIGFICIEWMFNQPAQGTLFTTNGNTIMRFPISGTSRLMIPEKVSGICYLRIRTQNKVFTEKIIIGK